LAAPATSLSSDQRSYIQTIRDSACGLFQQLNDLLDFAKIDAQKLHLAPAPFAPRQLVDSVSCMLQPLAQSRGLRLSVELSPLLPDWLLGDELRLRQVLVNLLGNGLKFCERGQVRLLLWARTYQPNTFELSFRIEDSGIGMSPQVVARLFQPFEQADGGIARKYGGTGLGLCISQQIVQAMGGQIQVESAVGVGSVFSFTLRLAIAEAPQQQAAA
jgi:signal transduction histidine kinase